MTKQGQKERDEAIARLRENGEPTYLGYNAAVAMGDRYDRDNEGIRVGGCGMDMGFHVVYNLSRTLFRDGYECLGPRCPSSAHTNGQPREETYTAETCPGRPCGSECDHKGTPKMIHTDGYALNQRWL